MELYDVLQPAGEMMCSKAELLVLIAGKKPLAWGRPGEPQIQFSILEGIFRCLKGHYLLTALTIDEWYLRMNVVL